MAGSVPCHEESQHRTKLPHPLLELPRLSQDRSTEESRPGGSLQEYRGSSLPVKRVAMLKLGKCETRCCFSFP